MKRNFVYALAGLAAAIAVAGVFGAIAFSEIKSQSSQTQSIGIGAYVTVEAYHEDGTMFHKWEGHNAITVQAQNALVSCITSKDLTPTGFSKCDFGIDNITITQKNQNSGASTFLFEPSDVTLSTEGCNTDFGQGETACTGWVMESTFDFNDLSCTPNVDCVDITHASSSDGAISFNIIDIDPDISIIPNDRLVVTMDFEIPP